MMYQTLTELRRAHPPEDEILLQYLVPATCKAAAVLGMVSAAPWAAAAGRVPGSPPQCEPGLRSLWAPRRVGELHLGLLCTLVRLSRRCVCPELAVGGPLSRGAAGPRLLSPGPLGTALSPSPVFPPHSGCQPVYRRADRPLGSPPILLLLMSTGQRHTPFLEKRTQGEAAATARSEARQHCPAPACPLGAHPLPEDQPA